jgi:hypothetical protein
MHRALRVLAVVILSSIAVLAQQKPGQATPAACGPNGQQLPFCKAVRGDRAEGWLYCSAVMKPCRTLPSRSCGMFGMRIGPDPQFRSKS